MKVVIVLDKNLPTGLLANAAAVLALSASRLIPEVIGEDVTDADGAIHPGITNLPLPILACGREELAVMRQKCSGLAVTCVGFTNVAQRAKRYEDYRAELKATRASGLHYLGICLCGESHLVKRLTGHLPLVK